MHLQLSHQTTDHVISNCTTKIDANYSVRIHDFIDTCILNSVSLKHLHSFAPNEENCYKRIPEKTTQNADKCDLRLRLYDNRGSSL